MNEKKRINNNKKDEKEAVKRKEAKEDTIEVHPGVPNGVSHSPGLL